MSCAEFRFYAELNDFLPADRRQKSFAHAFRGRASVKDMIESLGVPHTEVDLILANGRPVDFAYLVQDGDRISVYPVFESFDIAPAGRLRPEPLRVTRFALDGHLGRLAAYLRLLGFDSLYQNDWRDEDLARTAAAEERILLTRDRGLLKRNLVQRGYCVRSDRPRGQVMEVLGRLHLENSLDPFTRCLRCNGLLAPVDKLAIADRLAEGTRKHFEEFHQCRECGHIYWPGSHYKRMEEFIRGLSGAVESQPPRK